MSGVLGRTTKAEANPKQDPAGNRHSCEKCGPGDQEDELLVRYGVCSRCGRHHPVTARERVSMLADQGSFKETLARLAPADPLGFVDKVPYSQRLREARLKTGLHDAIITGTCRIDGEDAVLLVLEFEFLGGSMGSVVGEKVASACELAVRRKLPLVAVTRSGGARMQEGMLALAQMAKTSAAVARLHSSGQPFVVLFAHPTTGGVFASFGTLGDVLLAEPGALISFAGPRVAKAMAGDAAEAPRSAEFLREHGQIDAIIPRQESKHLIGELLRLAHSGQLRAVGKAPRLPAENVGMAAWTAVETARRSDRPTSVDYLRRMTSSFVEIHGDRVVGDDPAVVCGVADLDGQPLMVIAQERGHPSDETRRGGRARPEGYRKAQRAMRLAAKWRLPVLTLIDTPGADPGIESEAGGLGGTISRSMALMSQLPTPILSVVIGEGGSGGALALAVADRVLMMENSIFSVIAPEGASAILYRDAEHVSDVASALKITSRDLMELHIADAVVAEPDGGAHVDPERAALLLRRAIREEISALVAEPVSRLLRRRYERWRHMGRTASMAEVASERLAAQWESGLREGAQVLESISRRIPRRGE